MEPSCFMRLSNDSIFGLNTSQYELNLSRNNEYDLIVKDSTSSSAVVSSSPWSTSEDTSEPLDDAYLGDLKRSGELTIDEISLLADDILDPNRSFDLHSESSSNLTNETSQWSKEYDLVLIKSIEKSTIDCGIKEASHVLSCSESFCRERFEQLYSTGKRWSKIESDILKKKNAAESLPSSLFEKTGIFRTRDQIQRHLNYLDRKPRERELLSTQLENIQPTAAATNVPASSVSSSKAAFEWSKNNDLILIKAFTATPDLTTALSQAASCLGCTQDVCQARLIWLDSASQPWTDLEDETLKKFHSDPDRVIKHYEETGVFRRETQIKHRMKRLGIKSNCQAKKADSRKRTRFQNDSEDEYTPTNSKKSCRASSI